MAKFVVALRGTSSLIHWGLDCNVKNTAVCDGCSPWAMKGGLDLFYCWAINKEPGNGKALGFFYDVFAMYFTTHFIILVQYCRTDTAR